MGWQSWSTTGQLNWRENPKLGRLDTDRDREEITLTRWALRDDLPLFGICRGIQVLNVAAGGSLYQDIVDLVPGASNHARGDRERDWPAHEVELTPGSRVDTIVGNGNGRSMWVNSLHHQALKWVPPEFDVTARSADGVIETIERPGHRFCLAVQWHPEELTALPAMRGLFEALVRAARKDR
jgi:putative glutamine amidotransferase